MEDIYVIILASSMYIVLFGLISRFIRDTLYLPDPIMGILYGVAIGPYFLNIFVTNLFDSKQIVFHFSRVILSFQIMTISLQLPANYIRQRAKSLFVLVFIVSTISCLITFGIITYFTEYPLIDAWAIAVACTPTDPVLSSSILIGRFSEEYVSEDIRLLLASESAINDAIGLILLSFALDFPSHKLKDGILIFFYKTIFRKTIIPVAFGYVLGFLISKLFIYCHSKRLVGKTSMTVFGIALALMSMCLGVLINASEFLLVFFTGIAFSSTEWFVLEARGSQFQLIIESVFNITFFIFLGAKINWAFLDVKMIFLSLLILFFRRPLPVFLLKPYITEITTNGECFLVGWFGPIGIGAIYYALFADSKNIKASGLVIFVVIASVFLHGISVPIFRLIRYLWVVNDDESQIVDNDAKLMSVNQLNEIK